MNFASQILASAEKAASVAKNFKGFDEMAEEDDYIHSEGLNVKQTNPTSRNVEPNNQAKQQQQQQLLLQDDASAEPTWSLLDRPSNHLVTTMPNLATASSRDGSTITSASPASSISPPRQRSRTAPSAAAPAPVRDNLVMPRPVSSSSRGGFSKHRNLASQQPQQQPQVSSSFLGSMPLLPAVSDALQDGSSVSRSIRGRHSSYSGYDTDCEEGSSQKSSTSSSSSSSSSSNKSDYDSSDDEEDPILSQIRQSKQKQARKEKEKRKKKEQKKKKKKKKQSRKQKKKNPQRFLDEMDQRGAFPPPAALRDFSQPPPRAMEIETSATSTESTFSNLKRWIASPLQLQANSNNPNGFAAKASSFLKRGPLSRGRDYIATSMMTTQQQENKPEEDFQIVSSSNLLGDEEMAALVQFSNNNQSSRMSLLGLWKLTRKHPRECFILFTLLLSIFVYFYTRKISNEDDVQ